MANQYPVTCDTGKHLDIDCAHQKLLNYNDALKALGTAFGAVMNGVNAVYNANAAACNGDQACLANAAQAFVDNARAQLNQYNKGLDRALADYKNSLKECCVPDVETHWYDWIAGWFS